jgi:hypothetical protein
MEVFSLTVANIEVCDLTVANMEVCNLTVDNMEVCNLTVDNMEVCNLTIDNMEVCNLTVANMEVLQFDGNNLALYIQLGSRHRNVAPGFCDLSSCPGEKSGPHPGEKLTPRGEQRIFTRRGVLANLTRTRLSLTLGANFNP